MYHNDNTIIYVNGAFTKASEATKNLYSQSPHYGYAVVEGIKSYKTYWDIHIFKAKEHFGSLQYSASVMRMPFDKRMATKPLLSNTTGLPIQSIGKRAQPFPKPLIKPHTIHESIKYL